MFRLTDRLERVEEHSVAVLLRELKEEIAHLRNELSRIEGSIVTERLRTVEKALSQNYLMVYADQMEERLDEGLEHLVRENCVKRGRCVERFRAYLIGVLGIIRERELKDALADLDTKLSQIENAVHKARNTPCELCHKNVLETLRKEKKTFQKIAALELYHKDEKIEDRVDVSLIVKTILEPLASSARLQILIATYNGRKSFSELSEITKMRGGHLIFHLKKLLDTGLIIQERGKGDYVITPRGVDVIRKLIPLQLDNEQKSSNP